MSKIIVYDFDKTLTKKDTLFGFFRFNSKRNLSYIFKILIYIFLMVLTKFKIISNDRLKDLGIKLFLKNLTKEELDFKFENYGKTIEYNFLFKETNFETSDDIYIISASFEEYLKPIFSKNIKIIGSKINIEKNQLEFNCYAENKILALNNQEINHIDIFYTDSISDLPLAKLAKKIMLIKNDKMIECNNIEDFIKKAQ